MFDVRWPGLLLGAVALSSVPVAAQPVEVGPSAMVDTPCAPDQRAFSAEIASLMLTPGATMASLSSQGKRDIADAQRRDQEAQAKDFASLCRYEALNRAVKGRPDLVLIGDSITELWGIADHGLSDERIVDRGISGQTAPQMVLRFYQDVVALRPRAVHILAGTNDIAGNTGPSSPEDFKNTIRAMTELARAHGIRVLLGSIPPADHFYWNTAYRPAGRIRQLNAWLKAYAAREGFTYVDYHAPLATPQDGFRADLTNDGVHPNARGYAVMRPVLEAALTQRTPARR